MNKSITLLLVIVISVFIFGCSFNLSPRERVEELLNKYIKNDREIMKELNIYIKKQELNEYQKELYKEVILDEYSNLKYEIKRESIKKDKAEVKVRLKVKDLYKIENESIKYLYDHPKEFLTEGKFNQNKFLNYKLNQMKERNDLINYIVKFKLTRKNDVWFINKLSDETIKKIHGMYEYEL